MDCYIGKNACRSILGTCIGSGIQLASLSSRLNNHNTTLVIVRCCVLARNVRVIHVYTILVIPQILNEVLLNIKTKSDVELT